jgi:hypothetical protein
MATILSQFSKVKGYKNKNQGRTFACFIDFRKAYDSVMHRLLWDKSCRVKSGAFLSKEFLHSIGVRQGCVATLATPFQYLYQ